jgi:tetratricopeptide (TPR) repeat protein
MKRVTMLGIGLVWLMSAGAGTARAELTPPHRIGAERGSRESVQLASRAAAAEIAGNSQEALRLADQAVAADVTNPWAHYDRAAALGQLGQTDRAVTAFRTAEQRFSPSDRWARSIAIYGRAHALDQARRCGDAKSAFAEYASFVEKDDPRSAALARDYAQQCGAAAPAVAPNAGGGQPAGAAAPGAPATPASTQ